MKKENSGEIQESLKGLGYDPILMLSNHDGNISNGIYRVMFGEWPVGNEQMRYKVMYEHRHAKRLELDPSNVRILCEEDEKIGGTAKSRGYLFKGSFALNDGCDLMGECVLIGGNRYMVHRDSKVVYVVNMFGEEWCLDIVFGLDSDLEAEKVWFCKTFHFDGVNSDERQTYRYYYDSQIGFRYQYLDIPVVDASEELVRRNYNDDIPYGKICEFLESDDSGLVILHGEPGSGKTTFINHLMNKMGDITFAYMSASLLLRANEVEFVEHLIGNSDSKLVFIIEDCESIIASRETTRNSVLPTILNLTDGLLGKSLKAKFILTFNCPITKIDTAVLRKGRMKTKYEFKKLCLEKTRAILPDATKAMLLCDIYHRDDNGNREETAIGFGK